MELRYGSTYKISEEWSVRADLSNENRPRFYNRTSLSVGLSYRF